MFTATFLGVSCVAYFQVVQHLLGYTDRCPHLVGYGWENEFLLADLFPQELAFQIDELLAQSNHIAFKAFEVYSFAIDPVKYWTAIGQILIERIGSFHLFLLLISRKSSLVY